LVREERICLQGGEKNKIAAACRELHVVREDRKAGAGLFLWQDWMLFCMDPISRVPIQIDYADRYPHPVGQRVCPLRATRRHSSTASNSARRLNELALFA